MIDRLAKIEKARFVEGNFAIHFLYTAGVAGEKFLRALKQGKVLASTCPRCSKTYCPPRIFCEDCIVDITDTHEVKGTATVESYTTMHQALDGSPLEEPMVVGAFRMDGTDGTLIHRFLGPDSEDLQIGARVTPVWAKKREGSLLDIEGFKLSK